MFPQAKQLSKALNPNDGKEKILFDEKKRMGIGSIKKCLATVKSYSQKCRKENTVLVKSQFSNL